MYKISLVIMIGICILIVAMQFYPKKQEKENIRQETKIEFQVSAPSSDVEAVEPPKPPEEIKVIEDEVVEPPEPPIILEKKTKKIIQQKEKSKVDNSAKIRKYESDIGTLNKDLNKLNIQYGFLCGDYNQIIDQQNELKKRYDRRKKVESMRKSGYFVDGESVHLLDREARVLDDKKYNISKDISIAKNRIFEIKNKIKDLQEKIIVSKNVN